jgi:hypothetical protein
MNMFASFSDVRKKSNRGAEKEYEKYNATNNQYDSCNMIVRASVVKPPRGVGFFIKANLE